jgi:hypothetical protein
MLYRALVVLVGLGFVVYRGSLWWEIRKAHRSGDRAREAHLRRHGFGVYRWALGAGIVLLVVLIVIVWANSRGG